jgi:hypothetical protein
VSNLIAAHVQKVSHTYLIRYPEHGPRESDPHYADFHAYKALRRKNGTYHCDFAVEHRAGDTSECDLTAPLEAHHRVIEFATMNAVDLALLEHDYPGVSSMGVGAWVESAANLTLLCRLCHRGPGGVHVASASDYEAEKYVRNLIAPAGVPGAS